jgi:3-mercaptopyruvate sulfurtransferase SseA
MKHIALIRGVVMLTLGGVIIAGLAACNSNETLLSQRPVNQAPPPANTPAPDNVRRINAAELHQLWEKNDVVIIDTRPEPAYKQEHIKGSISMPTGMLEARFSELPKNKLIAAYCT